MRLLDAARRAASAGAAGAVARPADASFSTTCRRSIIAVSVAAPTTSAPRNGALQTGATYEAGEEGEASFVFMVDSDDFSGMLLTATERFPFPFSRWGMYSSSTAWKFVPPNPKALKPARRIPSAGMAHGLSSVFT